MRNQILMENGKDKFLVSLIKHHLNRNCNKSNTKRNSIESK